jgi:hypothetical protein
MAINTFLSNPKCVDNLFFFLLGDCNDRQAALRISVSGCPLCSLLAANAIPRVPVIKITQFLAAGWVVVMLLADIHDSLGNLKHQWSSWSIGMSTIG